MPASLAELHSKTHAELIAGAQAAGVDAAAGMCPDDLIFALLQHSAQAENQIYGRGVLEVHGEGFGFLRSPAANYLPGVDDIYVSQSQIRRFKLETGDTVLGLVRPPKEGERYLALLRVERVNGDPPGSEQPAFDSLTAIYPDDRLPLDTDPALKVVDFVAPIGLGQRGLLIAPSRTGREELLRRLVELLSGEDELALTVLLIEEKPEEIQEWRSHTRAEVVATTFDEAPARTLQIADIVFERARRRVERGDDVVVIVDSLSRLLRACLAEVPHVGRDLGGVDAAALHRLRRYMGAARALEEGGSLTVIGVLSGEPSSRSEQALIDDLRDVANWELTLSRDLADRGVRPAIDVHRSGNHRPQGLLTPEELEQRAAWRSKLTGDPVEDGAALIALLAKG